MTIRVAVPEDFVYGEQFVCIEDKRRHDERSNVTGGIFQCVTNPNNDGICMLISVINGIKRMININMSNLGNSDLQFVPVAPITDGDIMYAKLAGEWECVTVAHDRL